MSRTTLTALVIVLSTTVLALILTMSGVFGGRSHELAPDESELEALRQRIEFLENQREVEGRAMRRETDDCVMSRRVAAPVKVPVSQTARNTRMSSQVPSMCA